MSSLVGPVAGAVFAGGIYYGFSNMIQSRTTQLRADLKVLSKRLEDTPPMAENAPPSAADRIAQRPFTAMFQSRWNQQVETVFKHVGDWDQHVLDWGRKLFYGTDRRE